MSDSGSNPECSSLALSSPSSSSSHSTSIVAEHYDKKSSHSVDLTTRAQSPIYYLRNFNNWIKSVLINEFIRQLKGDDNAQHLSVLDLGCGKGGDILKWIKARVSHVTFVDVSETSIEKCQERYEDARQRPHLFSANFFHVDATRALLQEKFDAEADAAAFRREHDLVSSQFVIHYSFESFKQADMFMRNVSDSLRTGGYFIGTTTNANELVKRLRSHSTNKSQFGNELYQIKFEQKYADKSEPIDLFGVKFDFQLDNVVECPEFLLNFDCLIEIAKRRNLEFVMKKTFCEYFEENCYKQEYKQLLSIMDSLMPYYPRKFSQSRSQSGADEYEHIESKIRDETSFVRSAEGLHNEAYSTMSKSEWEVVNLYLVFAFVKIDPIAPTTTTTTTTKKRHLSSDDDADEIEKKQKKEAEQQPLYNK